MKQRFKTQAGGLLGLIIILILSGFTLLTFRDEQVDFPALINGGILCVILLLHFFLCTSFLKGIDHYPLIISYVLMSIGMILQWRINPEIASRQLIWISVGMALMFITMLVLRKTDRLIKLKWIMMVGSMGLLLLVLVAGNTQGGAKNWIGMGGFSFQPSEFIKIILIYILATELSEKTRLKELIWPLGVFVLGCVGLLVLSRDLGAALLFGLTSLFLFYLATGNWIATGVGLLAAGAGSVLAYQFFSHVQVRVAAWKNPWGSYESSGYQIAQGLMAIASGGLFGMGLNMGNPKVIPAYHTDYIFAVLCEELGIIVGCCVILFYVLLLLRGIAAAKHAKTRFNAILATGVTVMISLQTFLILGGVIKLIPLTGVTLPFVSYGGSSMMSNLMLIGILEAVIMDNNREEV